MPQVFHFVSCDQRPDGVQAIPLVWADARPAASLFETTLFIDQFLKGQMAQSVHQSGHGSRVGSGQYHCRCFDSRVAFVMSHRISYKADHESAGTTAAPQPPVSLPWYSLVPVHSSLLYAANLRMFSCLAGCSPRGRPNTSNGSGVRPKKPKMK